MSKPDQSGDAVNQFRNPCPTCGAKPGEPCLSLESKSSALPPSLVGKLYRNEVETHEARKHAD